LPSARSGQSSEASRLIPSSVVVVVVDVVDDDA
jgi:hypothetical protein